MTAQREQGRKYISSKATAYKQFLLDSLRWNGSGQADIYF